MEREHDLPQRDHSEELDAAISNIKALDQEYEEAVQRTQAAEEIADRLRSAEELKATELREALGNLISKAEGYYKRGEINWREYLEKWGAACDEDVTKLIEQLLRLAPGVPLIDTAKNANDTYFYTYTSNGEFQLALRAPCELNAYAYVGTHDEEAAIMVHEGTFIGNEAIFSYYYALLTCDKPDASATSALRHFKLVSDFARAIAAANIVVPNDLKEAYQLKLAEATNAFITSKFRSGSDIPILVDALIHNALIYENKDTKALDTLLLSGLVANDGNEFRKLGEILSIIENGRNSRHLVNKDNLTPQERLELMAEAQHKASDRLAQLQSSQE